MVRLRLLLVVVPLGLFLGLQTAWLAARSETPLSSISYGPWRAAPVAGTSRDDPYSRAALARTGELPLGSGEGLAMTAIRDSEGGRLVGRCGYRIEGRTPPARLWTLTVEKRANGALRAALPNSSILRREDGSFVLTVSNDPSPGNWVKSPDRGPLRFVLRLYDTTARTTTAISSVSMPSIERLSCA